MATQKITEKEVAEVLHDTAYILITQVTTSASGVEVEALRRIPLALVQEKLSGGSMDLTGYAKTEELPTLTSQLTNDSGFITNAVLDLLNYYSKSQTYTREEIDQKVSAIPKFAIKVVDVLPSEDISSTTIYLLKAGNDSGDLYTEYLWTEGKWEILGSQRVDLSGYVKSVNGIKPDPETGDVTITIPDSSQNLNPVAKTEDMTQPVGVDKNGQLWTAPTSGESGGETGEEVSDILLGTLPMTISESNCYLLSETNATISTGEGAEQLLDFDAIEPQVLDPTYNAGVVEKIGKNTVKITFNNATKNASVTIDYPFEVDKTYTMVGRVTERSSDVKDNSVILRVNHSGTFDQVALAKVGTLYFKTFVANAKTGNMTIVHQKNADTVVGETYSIVEVWLYEGEHTELPSGATFDILAGEKYNTDGYMGATLSEVNGKTVEVYKVNTAGAENETDNGGVIFFGDSILHYSDVVTRYAERTGKPVVNCAVGGTRMSASRDSTNAYYPLDMANIANAIASGDFSAQINSGLAPAGLTTLATANIANYKAIVLEFGTNDFSAEIPFDSEDATSIKGALKHILTSILTKYPNIRIVVLSTLQYVTKGTGNDSGVVIHPDGTVWEMNEVIKGICESDEFCVPFVDMYHAFGQNGITRNTLNSDGVHLTSPNGAKRYADILIGKLNALGI